MSGQGDAAHNPQHIILSGGDKLGRMRRLEQLELAVRSESPSVFRLPTGIGSDDAYVTAVRVHFPLESGSARTRLSLSWDQVRDVHIDWVTCQAPVLVVWPEIVLPRPEDSDWLAGILSDYVTELYVCRESATGREPRPWFQLTASINGPVGILPESLRLYYGREDEDERSEADIIGQYVRFESL